MAISYIHLRSSFSSTYCMTSYAFYANKQTLKVNGGFMIVAWYIRVVPRTTLMWTQLLTSWFRIISNHSMYLKKVAYHYHHHHHLHHIITIDNILIVIKVLFSPSWVGFVSSALIYLGLYYNRWLLTWFWILHSLKLKIIKEHFM